MKKREALGKGLSALISEDSSINQDHAYHPNLPVDHIKPNSFQPRMEINPETLLELADSIREHGIIEPLLVTQKDDDEYELIAGERRWRAAKLAGLKEVPAVIKETSPQQILEMAIVENLQREDLNPLEEALAFQQLSDKYNLTHKEISKKMGLSRPAVANKIRLLNLPEKVRKGLLEGKITEGHARALLGLSSKNSILAAYRKIIKDDLSVRAVEELVRRISLNQKKKKKYKSTLIHDKKTAQYEQQLQKIFDRKVKIYKSRKGGKIVIPFSSDKDFEKIQTLLGQHAEN